MSEAELIESEPVQLSLKDSQKAVIQQEVLKQLTMNLERQEMDTITRTEEVISPAVTRFIDIAEKEDGKDTYKLREDDFGNPVDIMGALGNIPAHQMHFIQVSNFNTIWVKLREGIYLDVYEKDDNGQLVIGEDGYPKLKYTKVIDVGALNKKLQLLSNLAYEQNRAKLQAQTMVGQSGGQPLGVGGSWDDTLSLLFGSGQRKK